LLGALHDSHLLGVLLERARPSTILVAVPLLQLLLVSLRHLGQIVQLGVHLVPELHLLSVDQTGAMDGIHSAGLHEEERILDNGLALRLPRIRLGKLLATPGSVFVCIAVGHVLHLLCLFDGVIPRARLFPALHFNPRRLLDRKHFDFLVLVAKPVRGIVSQLTGSGTVVEFVGGEEGEEQDRRCSVVRLRGVVGVRRGEEWEE